MDTVPAGEIKRRGMSAVDDLIAKGPVHVIRDTRIIIKVEIRDGEIILLDIGSRDEVYR
jgi:hypothetical protein